MTTPASLRATPSSGQHLRPVLSLSKGGSTAFWLKAPSALDRFLA
jgi:hypothetical protein